LALQNEIAQAVVREIQIKVNPNDRARLTPNRPVNRKAFDDYLQGRFLYWNRRTDENLLKAINFFQSSVSEDPGYAPAYVGLADCNNSLGTEAISVLSPAEARQRSAEAARKALEIDDQMAEAHTALGFVKHYNWDWTGAEQELKLAIELNPNYAYAHECYASLLLSRGQVDDAIVEMNRAQELDPFSLAISAKRGFILENARRYDEAIEQLRRVIAMDQNNFQAHWFLGHTYAASGRLVEAVAASERAIAISRTPGALGFLGMNYGLAGRKDDANKILNELLELNKRRYVTPPALANVYIGLGNKDQAFYWLEKAFQDRSNYMAYLKVFPGDDTLRSDPRFDDLLRRIGLL
jgi:tetratricopeptide (TPR) repeat protein